MPPSLATWALRRRLIQQALVSYRNQDWVLARRLFEELQRSSPTTLYKIYLDRIAHFIEQPPADDWDGVFALSTNQHEIGIRSAGPLAPL